MFPLRVHSLITLRIVYQLHTFV